MNILLTYFHFIGIMVLMGALITEHVMLKPGLTKAQVKSLATVDLIYGISAGVVLITGLLRWFVVGKGAAFYTKNPVFHTKLTLFVVIVILSVFPTIKMLKWRKAALGAEPLNIHDKEVKKLLLYIRIELFLLAVMPLLAVMISLGIGL